MYFKAFAIAVNYKIARNNSTIPPRSPRKRKLLFVSSGFRKYLTTTMLLQYNDIG